MTRTTQRRPVAVMTVSYLLVIAALTIGLSDYPESALPQIIAVAVYAVCVIVQLMTRDRSEVARVVSLIVQVGCMVTCFIYAPQTDTYSLLLLPHCIIVLHDYESRLGWMLVGVFCLVTGTMLVLGEGWLYAPNFIGLYSAAYVLVGAYSVTLKRAERERLRSGELLDQLSEANDKLREYAESIEQLTSLKERNRIARDLHDSVTQTIFSMTLITKSTLILQERDPEQVPARLSQLAELSQEALTEMRKLIAELRDTGPVSLRDGLLSRAGEFQNRTGIEARVEVSEDPSPLAPSAQQEVMRVVQEALNNVAKHSGATLVLIEAVEAQGSLVVTVKDDGIGFQPGAIQADRKHIGLSSMRERAEEIGGAFSLDSAPGSGTTVRIEVPLSGAATGGDSEEVRNDG